MKKLISVMILLFILSITAMGCNKEVFDGSRISNDVQFIMDYRVLNTTLTHEMQLTKDSTVDVAINSESGRIDVTVEDSSGNEIYRGDNAASGEYVLQIVKTDKYKFTVKGKNAKGGVSFIANKSEK